MGVVGAAIKGFGKALKVAKRNKESKKLFEKSGARSLQKQIESGVVDRNVKSKEVFKIIQEIKKPKKLRKFLKDKRTKAVGKGALVGGAVASGLEYKRRKDRGDYKK
jgi:hypothetical protein